MKTVLENIDVFKKSVHLALSIADKYEDDRGYEAALVGLYVGLNLHEKNKRSDKLELYLSWFIKTSIEHTLGYKNNDTKIWEEKFQEEK